MRSPYNVSRLGGSLCGQPATYSSEMPANRAGEFRCLGLLQLASPPDTICDPSCFVQTRQQEARRPQALLPLLCSR